MVFGVVALAVAALAPVVDGTPRRMWSTATAACLACLVAAIAVGAFAPGPLAYITPMGLVALGYAALGALQRDPWTTLTVLPGVVAAIILAAAHQSGWAVDLAFGVGLLGAGVTLLALERRRAQ